ncbi:hypothetical protein [Candidatus Paracaedibacter symbiosus]|uniref:hypothetical protein n=1 Tax=Candidatus Paracaedibacter symbiosus TaxID=244582 RepID=UPI0005096432|nr:hypothetical protein [Candidatus Paracaedibacter symbiosus]
MKYSTLKRLSITMCSLIMVLCSEVQSAQDLTDPETIASNKTKLFYQNEDTQLSDNELIAPETIKLEESSVSWTSYLFSPIQSAVYNTYKIINYATQSPQKAMIVGLILATNVAAVAADCHCYCNRTSWRLGRPETYGSNIGKASDLKMCSDVCNQNGGTMSGCYEQ